ncbi:MAG TPA: hypothetical protein VI356_14135 [Myxococcales bacterium]
MSCVTVPAIHPIVARHRNGLQLAVALKLLERLLPCPRDATAEQRLCAVDLAVRGAFHACELYPVDELTPESLRYLTGEERIGLLERCLRRGPPPPAASDGLRATSLLLRAIGGVVDRGLSLEDALAAAVDGEGKLR